MMNQGNKYGYVRVQIHPESSGDRVAFEMTLPRDAQKAVAVTAVCIPGLNASDWLDGEAIPTRSAGRLSFRFEGIGDIFMQMPVHTGLHYDEDNNFSQIQAFGTTQIAGPEFQYSADQIKWEPIALEGETRTIQGYYVDDLNRFTNVTESYQLVIYLRYLKKA